MSAYSVNLDIITAQGGIMTARIFLAFRANCGGAVFPGLGGVWCSTGVSSVFSRISSYTPGSCWSCVYRARTRDRTK